MSQPFGLKYIYPKWLFSPPVLEGVEVTCIVLLPSVLIVPVSKSRKRTGRSENIK